VIGDAIDQLEPMQSKILQMRFIKKFNWTKISIELYIIERCGRYHQSYRLDNLAYLFYGDKAVERLPSKKAC